MQLRSVTLLGLVRLWPRRRRSDRVVVDPTRNRESHRSFGRVVRLRQAEIRQQQAKERAS